MKKNKSTLIDDEIDIRNLVQNLWQHKILILSVSILSMLLAYIITPNSNDNNPNYIKTIISVKKTSKNTFESYAKIYDQNYLSKSNIYIDFHKEFNDQLTINFLDLNNIVLFLEESKDFDDFKIFLKSKKISSWDYFYNKNYGIENSNIDLRNIFFFLILPEKIERNKLLNNYANYILDITKISIKNLINREIDNIIIQNENTLDKIKTLNSTDLPKWFLENKDEKYLHKILDLPSHKELLQKISSLKELKFLLDEHLSNLDIKFYIISGDLSSQVDRPNPSNINSLLGLIFGFFLSLVIILFKKRFFNYT
jgi:hypothetical protein